MTKVTGIGGIFFKSKKPKELSNWYEKHLGLPKNEYGAMFTSFEGEEAKEKVYTQWSPFEENTTYFQPSNKEFMINYRVADLVSLVEEMKSEGINFLDEIEEYDYGKFIHFLDPEGNKVELWEPKGEL